MAIPAAWMRKLESKKMCEVINKSCEELGPHQFKVLCFVKHEQWDGAVIVDNRGIKYLTTGVLVQLLSGIYSSQFEKMKLVTSDKVNVQLILDYWNRNQTCELII